MRREWMWAAAMTVSMAGLAVGQNQPAGQPGNTPAGQPPVLESPKTAPTADSKPTLVQRDDEGKLKRLEVPPEEAAVQIMELEPAERERVNKILAERAATLDEIVVKNFDLLTKLHSALQSGDQTEIRKAYAAFTPKMERLQDRGKLEDELRPALRMDHVDEFNRLVAQYRQTLIQEGHREAKAAGKEITAQSIANREIMASMGQSLKRSYDRTVGTKVAEFDSVLSKLTLKPEQETRIRDLTAEFAQKHAGKATPEQKRDLVMQMLKEMDADQRLVFIKLLREGQ